MSRARVTDAVTFYAERGDRRHAVREVRSRRPDKFRWRNAVGRLTQEAGHMRGLERLRVEEPVREVVVDLSDTLLRREVVIDARRHNVDLDRGEVLPFHRMGDLRTYAYLAGADIALVQRYVALPEDFDAPVDTAGVVLVARAMANQHKRRAQRIWLELPDPDSGATPMLHHRYLGERARRDAEHAKRWTALTNTLLGDPTPK
ncbi:MAG: hypothetical protein GW913_11110 [Myxococcales bacterium]|nr:hypothetical protein [Myxococcales bacterium]